MIRLFESTATSFDTLGLGNLTDATKALVVEERNGEFEIELDYPIDGVHYKDIALRCIIYCRPNPYTDEQPFRIYYISKPISGIVTIKAAHLSYDLSGIVVNPFSANSPGEALTGIKKNASTPCPFNFTTTKTGDAGFNVEVPKSARSILAGSEGSVLDIYGKGEYEFNGYDVKLHLNRGANNGVTLRYGKNIIDLNQEENCSNMYTGVYPYWKGSVSEIVHKKEEDADGNTYEAEETNYIDTLVVLPEKIVNAEGTFNFTNIYPLDLSSEFQSENQTAPTQEQIRNRAKQYMADNNIGIPKINLTVSFVVLEQAEEYEQLRLLEKVNLCDTVTIIFEKLGVNATAKCIKTVYNAITNKYESLEFGDSSTKFVDNIIDQSEAVQDIPTKGFMELAIDRATKLITGGLGGYALLHSSTGSDTPDEILILEPESKGEYKNANRIWRWNYAGLGYSNNGYNGPYELAMTMDGQINAKFVNTGQLSVGGTGGPTIIVYGADGTTELVKFDNTGIHLLNGQKIDWSLIKDPPDFATKKYASDAASDAAKPLFKGVTTYYYAKKVLAGATKPAAPGNPSNQVTSKVWDQWSTVCQDVDTTPADANTEKYKYDCYFWMCPVYTKANNSLVYGAVTEFDNSLATTIITKNAITTSFINALNVTAQNISATAISGKNISGGTLIGTLIKNSVENPTFQVTADGTLTATKGKIGGFKLENNVLASVALNDQGQERSGVGVWIYPAGGHSSIFGKLEYGGIVLGEAGKGLYCLGYIDDDGSPRIAKAVGGTNDIEVLTRSSDIWHRP